MGPSCRCDPRQEGHRACQRRRAQSRYTLRAGGTEFPYAANMTPEQIASLEAARAASRRALKAVSDFRKSSACHHGLIGRNVDLVAQSMDLVARSRARLAELQPGPKRGPRNE